MHTLVTDFTIWQHFDTNPRAVVCFVLYVPLLNVDVNCPCLRRKVFQRNCFAQQEPFHTILPWVL